MVSHGHQFTQAHTLLVPNLRLLLFVCRLPCILDGAAFSRAGRQHQVLVQVQCDLHVMSVRVQEGCNGILLKEDRRRFRVFDLTTAKRAQGLTVHHLRDADGVDSRIVVLVTCHLFQIVALFIAIFASVVVVVVVTCHLF